jgi:hypothetical protein
MAADWTVAMDEGLTERCRFVRCLLCGAAPIAWWDLIDLDGWGVGYSVCGPCRKRDPEAVQVRAVLQARYQHARGSEVYGNSHRP